VIVELNKSRISALIEMVDVDKLHLYYKHDLKLRMNQQSKGKYRFL
jgi:hypothetical protein